jgi:hypothetical protein
MELNFVDFDFEFEEIQSEDDEIKLSSPFLGYSSSSSSNQTIESCQSKLQEMIHLSSRSKQFELFGMLTRTSDHLEKQDVYQALNQLLDIVNQSIQIDLPLSKLKDCPFFLMPYALPRGKRKMSRHQQDSWSSFISTLSWASEGAPALYTLFRDSQRVCYMFISDETDRSSSLRVIRKKIAFEAEYGEVFRWKTQHPKTSSQLSWLPEGTEKSKTKSDELRLCRTLIHKLDVPNLWFMDYMYTRK